MGTARCAPKERVVFILLFSYAGKETQGDAGVDVSERRERDRRLGSRLLTPMLLEQGVSLFEKTRNGGIPRCPSTGSGQAAPFERFAFSGQSVRTSRLSRRQASGMTAKTNCYSNALSSRGAKRRGITPCFAQEGFLVRQSGLGMTTKAGILAIRGGLPSRANEVSRGTAALPFTPFERFALSGQGVMALLASGQAALAGGKQAE